MPGRRRPRRRRRRHRPRSCRRPRPRARARRSRADRSDRASPEWGTGCEPPCRHPTTTLPETARPDRRRETDRVRLSLVAPMLSRGNRGWRRARGRCRGTAGCRGFRARRRSARSRSMPASVSTSSTISDWPGVLPRRAREHLVRGVRVDLGRAARGHHHVAAEQVLHRGGRDRRARPQRVGGDPVLRELGREAERHHRHAVLGERVAGVRAEPLRVEVERRRKRQDVRVLGLAQDRAPPPARA